MKVRRHITTITATVALAGLVGLGLAAPAQSAPQSWKCRDATASTTGAKIAASICWSGSTAKVAGQVYDTKADRHSGCGEIIKASNSAYNYCARKGAGTSVHFVTGEFHYSHPVWIRACTENGPVSGQKCSAWH
ncbi:hypothetical protein ACIQCJ_19120 [Streptomyces sp. NPDC093221]|uniref:hypothetical protein n=1 Tax=Streptomyces sp. NPDC093221 TaxID=3366032 RepID=UPI00381E72C0